MFENDNCHYVGTTDVGKSWEGTPEEESHEPISANKHRGCGYDMLGQTVPVQAAATGKAQSLTLDSCV